MRHEWFEDAPLVESWLKEPVWLPESDLGRTGQLVHQTPQRRRGLPQSWRFQPMFSATKLVVGGIVVALFSGFLLSGVLPTGPNDESVPAAATADSTAVATAGATAAPVPTEGEARTGVQGTITLPDELPEGARTGTIETAAGPVEWVHLRGPSMLEADTDGIHPRMESLVPWDDGIAAIYSSGGERHLWSTTDGIQWKPEVLPASGELGVVDGTAVLVSPGSLRVWTRALGGGDWQELDASAIAEAMPAPGWARPDEATAREPVGLDGQIVIPIAQRYTLPRRALGIPARDDRYNQLKRLGQKRYALCGGGSCPDGPRQAKWKIRFDETTTGLRVTDDRTGEVLGVIAGADASDLYEGHRSNGRLSFTIEGSRVVPVDVPWALLDQKAAESTPTPPAGTDPWSGATDWLVADYRSGGLSMMVRDEWVSLEPLGLGPGVFLHPRDVEEDRTGNVAMIATDLSPIEGVYLLVLPEGA